MIHDFRYAARSLRKEFGFAAVAAFTLALGIGANTAIFTVVNALLLRPLPYAHSERLMTFYATNPKRALGRGGFSMMRLDQVRSESRAYDSIAGNCSETFNLTGVDEPEQLAAARVSANFLQTLGIHPLLGRDFLPEEDREGGRAVVLLSYGFWQRRFAGNLSVVGAAINLDATSYTVIGVLPPGLDQPQPDLALLATNLAGFSLFTREQIQAGAGYINGTARLKSGVSVSQAQAEMDVMTQHYLRANSGKTDADPDARMMVSSLQSALVENIKPALLVLCAAVGAVLLIACANVASLLLARASGRRKELAVRAALGASRADLIRHLLAESLLLAAIGGGTGLLLAFAGVRVLSTASQLQLPRVQEIHLDWQTLAFALAISLVTGILFGLAPSLHASRPDLNSILREDGRGTAGSLRRNRTRSLLVIGQVAASIILLIAAGLLVRSFMELQHVDPGFDPRHVLTMQVTLPGTKYRNPAAQNNFFQDTLPKIAALPGVQNASAILSLPLTQRILAPIQKQGDPSLPFGKRSLLFWESITPDYFQTLKIRLVRGRFFTPHDDANSAGVAIINETAARRFWPNEDPIGKRVLVARAELREEVVGVIADVRSGGLASDVDSELYTPYAQRPWSSMYIAVRTAGDPASASSAVRRQILEADHDLPVTSVRPMEEIVADSFGQRRVMLWLFGVFGAAALTLAAVGIYGLLAYSVAQRSREMGIRRALGAQPGSILSLVLKQGITLAAAGVAVGLAGAWAVTRGLSTLLFHVSPTDPLLFGAVALLFLTVAAAASYLPARRAVEVDPLVAMRE